MDLPSRKRWYEYSRARDLMLEEDRHAGIAPWYIVRSDDKRAARLNTIAHMLSVIPHKKLPHEEGGAAEAVVQGRVQRRRVNRAPAIRARAVLNPLMPPVPRPERRRLHDEMPSSPSARCSCSLDSVWRSRPDRRHVSRPGRKRGRDGQAGPEAGRARSPARPSRALSRPAARADAALCASNPGKVAALDEWLASNQTLKGSELQDAATKSGFDPSFVALVLFPQVVSAMAEQLDWTTRLGQAFAADRTAVFASIQRLEGEGQRRREAEEHPATGGRDPHDVERPAGDRDRAGQPAGRLRSAIQPADRLPSRLRPRWSFKKKATAMQPWRRA